MLLSAQFEMSGAVYIFRIDFTSHTRGEGVVYIFRIDFTSHYILKFLDRKIDENTRSAAAARSCSGGRRRSTGGGGGDDGGVSARPREHGPDAGIGNKSKPE